MFLLVRSSAYIPFEVLAAEGGYYNNVGRLPHYLVLSVLFCCVGLLLHGPFNKKMAFFL